MNKKWGTNSKSAPNNHHPKECVAVLIELYKKNVTVSCVGSDLLPEWAFPLPRMGHSIGAHLPIEKTALASQYV